MRSPSPKLALLVLSLVATAAAGRADDPPKGEVTLVPKWKQGDVVRYEMTKTKRKTQAGKVAQDVAAKTPVDLTVVEANKDGYVVRWTQGGTRLADPKLADNPLVRETADLAKDYQVLLELDTEASLTGVRNWEEVKRFVEKMADLTVKAQRAQGVPQATIDKVRAQALSMFATKEQVVQNCTRDPQMLILPLGRSLERDRPLEYDDQLANPFGGEPFPTKARFTLAAIDRAKGTAVVSWTQSFDPEEAKRILEGTLKAMAEKLGRPAPNADLLKTMAIDDRAEYTVDLATGWVRSMTHTRTTSVGDVKQEAILSFTPRAEK